MIISAETIAYYDTNGDNGINLEDMVEYEHYEILVEYCDFNGDGTVSSCEVHDCIEICENEWRAEYCPDYGYVYCACPFEDYSPPENCPGEWTCDDIEWITASDFDYLDANYDGLLDINDNLELTELGNACDLNGDNNLEICEHHVCVINYENEWRLSACPEGYPSIWCDCPFEAY
jgi:hypothetical protein